MQAAQKFDKTESAHKGYVAPCSLDFPDPMQMSRLLISWVRRPASSVVWTCLNTWTLHIDLARRILPILVWVRSGNELVLRAKGLELQSINLDPLHSAAMLLIIVVCARGALALRRI